MMDKAWVFSPLFKEGPGEIFITGLCVMKAMGVREEGNGLQWMAKDDVVG